MIACYTRQILSILFLTLTCIQFLHSFSTIKNIRDTEIYMHHLVLKRNIISTMPQYASIIISKSKKTDILRITNTEARSRAVEKQ
jgi:hypothetical protein